ncbi:hypothetical protein THRCLA_22042 [Thraustotheca clavata]|uniref:Crinkler (CRN) family protein n=1 Tax=Thraustotheca clavata TaxID=74557 RepID=A0A1V9ZD77_9STRA|nr:hypothetical protein THRCLA_22042 [Thraustotheca clavata]
MLATFGQFDTNAINAGQYVQECILPYWKDLEYFALNYMKKKYSGNLHARYYISGGNSREFLDKDGLPEKRAFKAIKTIKDPSVLLSDDGLSLDLQVDPVRMLGVKDRNNIEHYTDIESWTTCVTNNDGTKFFEKLMRIAKLMGDDRLLGVA